MGHGEVLNVVNLKVISWDKESQADGTYNYTYTFSVTLLEDYPDPSFGSNNLSAVIAQDDNSDPDKVHYELFVSYEHDIPTTLPPGGFHEHTEGYKTHHLTYIDYSNNLDINKGAVTFMGSNFDAQGKKVRAKSSTNVGQPLDQK
ncbi:hypothetical protein [Aurantibacillus circumpalustris]|uniref:hypothetical protein n=1 Tax=Aurantibacillus circumpalustris TaxID=3036359 RepID=UPI00295AC3F2|nr:hypothetical protein [Aurantibacillus circumpalustris]